MVSVWSIPLSIADAFLWTVYGMAGRRAPGAVYKYWVQGQDLWLGRDQFDVWAHGLAEINSEIGSVSVPAA